LRLPHFQYKIVLPPREINPRDTRATLQAILRRWLPLSEAVLRMIIRTVPDPVTAQRQRLFTLLPGVTEQAGLTDQAEAATPAAPAAPQPVIDYSKTRLPLEVARAPRTEEVCEQIAGSYDAVKDCVARCDHSPEAPVVVFVSKMVPVRVAELSQRDIAMVNARLARAAESAVLAEGEVAPPSALKPDGEVFVALARVFSGTLTRTSPLYVLGSKYDPRNDPRSTAACTKDVSADETTGEKAQVDITGLTPLPADMTMGLYIMLGPSVVPVEQVPAGNIVGIVGLSEMILKTATLSSTWATYPMNAITFQSKPMLKVAVEPISHVDLRALEFGLQQLHQFDPVVEIGVDGDTGQNTMTCLGELHLEQCVKALTERFAK
jgi:ribosome assembly protein 1